MTTAVTQHCLQMNFPFYLRCSCKMVIHITQSGEFYIRKIEKKAGKNEKINLDYSLYIPPTGKEVHKNPKRAIRNFNYLQEDTHFGRYITQERKTNKEGIQKKHHLQDTLRRVHKGICRPDIWNIKEKNRRTCKMVPEKAQTPYFKID